MNWKYINLIVFISALLFQACKSGESEPHITDAEWNFTKTFQCRSILDTGYAKGDSATFCVHFLVVSKNYTPVGKRIIYSVIVDDYTQVQIKGAYGLFYSMMSANSSIDSVYMLIQLDNNITSTPVLFLKRTETYFQVIPLFSAVANIDKGAIRRIDWDDDCWDCVGTACSEELIYWGPPKIYEKNCISSCSYNASDPSASYECDPKIYISWLNTDVNGDYMTSAGLRISRFKQFSISKMYQSAMSTYNGIKDTVTNNWNDIFDYNANKSNTTNTTTPTTFLKTSNKRILNRGYERFQDLEDEGNNNKDNTQTNPANPLTKERMPDNQKNTQNNNNNFNKNNAESHDDKNNENI